MGIIFSRQNLYFQTKPLLLFDKNSGQIPAKSVHRNRNRNQMVLPVPEPKPEPEFRSITKHEYTIRNVEGYNKLLHEVCSYTSTYLLDIFSKFLCLNLQSRNYYRRESYFIDYRNIHPNKLGLGVLARSYIKLIHSSRFNPLGY